MSKFRITQKGYRTIEVNTETIVELPEGETPDSGDIYDLIPDVDDCWNDWNVCHIAIEDIDPPKWEEIPE